MNTDERREVIKALAYGKSHAEIRECMGVTDDDINSVTVAEVDAKHAELKAKGYIR